MHACHNLIVLAACVVCAMYLERLLQQDYRVGVPSTIGIKDVKKIKHFASDAGLFANRCIQKATAAKTHKTQGLKVAPSSTVRQRPGLSNHPLGIQALLHMSTA